MIYKLKILSPVHIGCGEKYSGLNFIIDKGRMFYIDPETFISTLQENRVADFVKWIETCSQSLNELENKRESLRRSKDPNARKEESRIWPKINAQKKNFTLYNFVTENGLNLQEIIKKASYSVKTLKNIYNDSEINPFIKQINRPYIPGSEIKGAIRTAVLYEALINNHEIGQWLESKLQEFHKDNANNINKVKNVKNLRGETRAAKKKLSKEMAKIESDFQKEVLRSKSDDAKYDVMKYLQISDSELLDADRVLAVSVVQPINIGRRFSVHNEYIRPDTAINLFMVSLEESRSLKLEKMEFSGKQQKIVSDMDQIFKSCCGFSNALLDEEIRFFEKQEANEYPLQQNKNQILGHLKDIKATNRPDAPVLRIGKDEGFNSLTVGLAVKNLYPDLYENVLIHATRNKSYDSKHGGPMPKTRKLVDWYGEKLTAGWVQLLPGKYFEIQQPAFEKNIPGQQDQTQSPTASLDLSGLATRFKVKETKK